MSRIIIRVGLISLALVLLVQLSKFSWLNLDLDTEIIVGGMAIAFMALGIIFNRFLQKPKREVSIELDPEAPKKQGISEREMEVLRLMAEGNSNKEIAERLFVSENTVKTHISNLFIKVDAKRRTEAIKKAQELGLIA